MRSFLREGALPHGASRLNASVWSRRSKLVRYVEPVLAAAQRGSVRAKEASMKGDIYKPIKSYAATTAHPRVEWVVMRRRARPPVYHTCLHNRTSPSILSSIVDHQCNSCISLCRSQFARGGDHWSGWRYEISKAVGTICDQDAINLRPLITNGERD